MPDVVVVGAGHNGLVAAARLARSGLSVTVVEADAVIGGACRTEHPFPDAPEIASSTGAYLLGLMPPEIVSGLELDLPLQRRDPHYLLPGRPGRTPLLLGSDPAANASALTEAFTAVDARADAAMATELAALRSDLGPSWLEPATPIEATAERYVRRDLRQPYVDLVRGSALDYYARFGYVSDELVAMYAATDGMPGSALAPDEAGTGHNLLVHSMCRLPGSGGTWMAVPGGMGVVTDQLRRAALGAGARIRVSSPVARITTSGGTVDGVLLESGESIAAPAVVAAVDPYRLAGLVDLPTLEERLAQWRTMPGLTLKINLALSSPLDFGVPLPGAGTTVHLLPEPVDGSYVRALRCSYEDARAGRLPQTPAIEVYTSQGLATGVFVQGVPNVPHGSSWDAESGSYVDLLLDRVEAAAPGLRARLRGMLALTPAHIESRFGITTGHIFHVDNSVPTDQRLPLRPGPDGLYAGAAGCHPAGSVIGAAGWIAAGAVAADLGR
jgi:phytoene dehydrogenase-like protein